MLVLGFAVAVMPVLDIPVVVVIAMASSDGDRRTGGRHCG